MDLIPDDSRYAKGGILTPIADFAHSRSHERHSWSRSHNGDTDCRATDGSNPSAVQGFRSGASKPRLVSNLPLRRNVSNAERFEAWADAWSTTRGMVIAIPLSIAAWAVVLASGYSLYALARANYEAAAWISFGACLIFAALAIDYAPRIARWAWSWVRS